MSVYVCFYEWNGDVLSVEADNKGDLASLVPESVPPERRLVCDKEEFYEKLIRFNAFCKQNGHTMFEFFSEHNRREGYYPGEYDMPPRRQ
ncbi:MAG: hypothetical protein U0105_17365 [Candidatus Obscuribacterales bacterium]